MTVPGVGTLMGPIEKALREKIFPALFGGEEINADFRKILGHSVKHSGLGIPDLRLSEESSYNTSTAASGELIDSLLGGSAHNCIGHRACAHKANLAARHAKMHVKPGELTRRKELAGGQERNRLHREMKDVAWLSAVPHRLNGTELSWEEFQDNLHLRYGLMPQDIPVTCDGLGKKLSTKHALSCPKCGLVLARHDDAAKEWGTLGARDLFPSAFTYKPKINSRTVRGGRTGTGARQERETDDDGADTVGEAQGGR